MYVFLYTENVVEYKNYLSFYIKDCLCKHVLFTDSTKASRVLELSLKNNYPECKWGYWRGLDDEQNRLVQISTIATMLHDGYTRPVRLVIDKSGVLWVDNLHSAILYMYVYGYNAMLNDIPNYIIDCRNDVPVVVSTYRGSVRDSLYDIKGAIGVSVKRCLRAIPEIVSVHYTIDEFIQDNNLSLDDSMNQAVCKYREVVSMGRFN